MAPEEAPLFDAARRLLKSQLRHATFVHRWGADSSLAELEEGIVEDAQEAWQKELASWGPSMTKDKLLLILEQALAVAVDHTKSFFDEGTQEATFIDEASGKIDLSALMKMP